MGAGVVEVHGATGVDWKEQVTSWLSFDLTGFSFCLLGCLFPLTPFQRGICPMLWSWTLDLQLYSFLQMNETRDFSSMP